MPQLGKLEPDYQADFEAWQKAPTPESTSQMLATIEPAISRGIQTHFGSRDISPTLKSHARRLALQALKTYDPYQSRLSTHVINHLQGLRRVARRQQQIFRVPERVASDQAFVNEQRTHLTDQMGREPSTAELADHTGLSMKRLAYLTQFRTPTAEGTLSALQTEDGDGSGFIPSVMSSSDTATEAVYGDLDGMNQRIMELGLGLHGHRTMSNPDIARMLRLSPGAVSQRKALIQGKLQEMQGLNLF